MKRRAPPAENSTGERRPPPAAENSTGELRARNLLRDAGTPERTSVPAAAGTGARIVSNTRPLRSTFGQSTLVRLLGQWTPVQAEASGLDVAERLSAWVGTLDAIRLQSAHQAIRAMGPAGTAPRVGSVAARARALAEDLQRVRSALAHAIAQDPVQLAAGPALRPAAGRVEPVKASAASELADIGPALYQQRHADLQRQMDLMIAPLREHVRGALARASTPLRQLAALDATLEEVFAPREQALLPTTGALLERRFEQLRQAHRDALAAAGAEDDPARWRRAGGWLHAFEQDWREALHAELQLRLAPVTGLVEAFGKESDLRT
jgi:hypothetical protein